MVKTVFASRRRAPFGLMFLVSVVVGVSAMTANVLAQDVTLKLHHYHTAESSFRTDFLNPLMKELEQLSDGSLKIELVADENPHSLYGRVRTGQIDMAWSSTGFTPDAFSRSMVFSLPFVGHRSALVTNKAIYHVFDDRLANDFSGMQPLLLHAGPNKVFQTSVRPIRTLADMNGQLLVSESWIDDLTFKALGATSLQVDKSNPDDLIRAFDEGKASGILSSVASGNENGMRERTFYVSVPSSKTEREKSFGAEIYWLAISQRVYNELPEGLQTALLEKSGARLAGRAGELMDQLSSDAMEKARADGTEFYKIGSENLDAMQATLAPVTLEWIRNVRALGINAGALLQSARDASLKAASE